MNRRLYRNSWFSLEKLIYRFALVAAIALCFIVFKNDTYDVMSRTINDIVVVIDAGHGGRDPGASGKSGVAEEDVNLAIAMKLRKLIEQYGGTAIMIREDDSGLYSEDGGGFGTRKAEDLHKRKEIINNSNADIYISIHLNYFPQTQYYGAQTFYNRGDDKGRILAERIQKELIATMDRGNDRVAKPTKDVFILKDNKIPGALVECGFLSNEEEERLLAQGSYQQKLAWCLFSGIVKYFEEESVNKSN